MSRVKIRKFGPDVNPNEITMKMNGFLDNWNIKYVNHTYSVVSNPNVEDFVKEMRSYKAHLYFGSIAYYIREEENEDKKKKD